MLFSEISLKEVFYLICPEQAFLHNASILLFCCGWRGVHFSLLRGRPLFYSCCGEYWNLPHVQRSTKRKTRNLTKLVTNLTILHGCLLLTQKATNEAQYIAIFGNQNKTDIINPIRNIVLINVYLTYEVFRNQCVVIYIFYFVTIIV